MPNYVDDSAIPNNVESRFFPAWPNGTRLAIWLVLNVECWPVDYLGPGGMPWPQTPPDVPNSTFREYGNRVGVWRLIAMLDRLGIPASIALNGAMCEFHPEIVKSFADRNWDIMGHGVDQSRPLNRISPEEEASDIAQTLAAIERACGHRPKGWLGPGLAQTAATPDLLAYEGVHYIADRLDDQLPYRIRTKSKPLVSVPYSLDLNDYSAFAGLALTGRQYGEMLRDQFEVLHREARSETRVMCIPLHTYLSGTPHRSKHIEEALAFMKQHDNVWFTTGADIATAFETLVPVG